VEGRNIKLNMLMNNKKATNSIICDHCCLWKSDRNLYIVAAGKTVSETTYNVFSGTLNLTTLCLKKCAIPSSEFFLKIG